MARLSAGVLSSQKVTFKDIFFADNHPAKKVFHFELNTSTNLFNQLFTRGFAHEIGVQYHCSRFGG